MKSERIIGHNCLVSEKAVLGNCIRIGHNCIIEDNVKLGDNVYIEDNSIIRSGVTIGANTIIGSNCIIGEHTADYYNRTSTNGLELYIGSNSLIRSGSIIYTGSKIGDFFQTGHQVTIREKTTIGNHVSIGTLSDIQGNCTIGNYVRLHSNVHIGQKSVIDNFVWIFPYVILTNDPTPPSEIMQGVHIEPFAIVATGAIIMPGINIASDSLIAAGAIVTKNVNRYEVVGGNPGKVISDVRKIKNKNTGEAVYPWRYHFNRAMPWEKFGFSSWYSSLDIEAVKEYRLDFLQEDF